MAEIMGESLGIRRKTQRKMVTHQAHARAFGWQVQKAVEQRGEEIARQESAKMLE